MDEMITLTTDVKKDIGLTSARIRKNEHDYMVIPKKCSDEKCILTCPKNMDINYYDTMTLSLTIDENIENIQIEIENFSENAGFNVTECTLLSRLPEKMLDILRKWEKINSETDLRKEDRILCTEENVEEIGIIPLISIQFRECEYTAYIKDLSFSACRIITTTRIMEENGEIFTIRLKFRNPEMACIFQSKVIRKEEYVIDGKKLAQIVFFLDENTKYKKRLSCFYEKQERRLASGRRI